MRAPETKRADAVWGHQAGSHHNHPLLTKGHVMATADSTASRGGLNIAKEVAAMQRMTVDQLRDKYADVFGEMPRSRHKEWLVKRIA